MYIERGDFMKYIIDEYGEAIVSVAVGILLLSSIVAFLIYIIINV